MDRVVLRRMVAAALLPLCCAGCFQSPPKTTTPAAEDPAAAATPDKPAVARPAASDMDAAAILAELLKIYRAADSYADEGVVKLEFVQNGQKSGDQWPSAVKFSRPNKLSVVAFQATVKCDGQELIAKIDDQATGNLDGQVLVQPAPQELQLSHLASDPLLYDILSSQLRRQPIQLELLFESGGLAAAFGKDIACRRLDDGQAEGHACFRVEVPSPGGPFVFWVDRADFLLRRLDYPVAALLPAAAADPSVSELRLSAELFGARIGEPTAAAEFQMEIPADAKRMKSLVVPPRPLPTELFGREPEAFFFTDLDGNKLESLQLGGRVAVLVWYQNHPACQATLEQVALARKTLMDDDAVKFYAVATDPTSASNAELRKLLADWRVDLPIVRDLEAFGKNVFQIDMQPTIVVLDEQGRIQVFQTGGSPQLGEQLVHIAERLKKGDDLAAEILAQYERDRKQYDELIAQGGPEPGQVIELPEAVIRRRSEPTTLQLTELWTTTEVKLPGNLLVVEQEQGSPRLYAIEGWRTVVELDPEGKVLARHALELPEQAAVTYLRTTQDKSGKRVFAGGAPLAPEFFLFDENWQLVRSFPAADQTPLQLTDLAWADVNDADGAAEMLAGNVGSLGLMAVKTDGEIAWRNREFADVVSVAVSQPNDVGSWAIFLAGERGTVLRVNRFGLDEPPVQIGNWPIVRLAAARFAGAKQASLLGISNNAQGELFAIGITDDLKEAWNYPLPAGVHQKPIEFISSSHILPGRQGEWWLAGPDGSVHVISEEGEFHDSFFSGVPLTGLAATRFDQSPVLILASDAGITAWKIGTPQRER
ncbi:MAG: TlpA disulfide reductase family protein [Pirellulaceae bacterium]